MRRWMVLLAILLMSDTGWPATYYVSTAGNDANSGAVDSPWRNPNRCSKTPIAPGDTCVVKAGTYQASDWGSTYATIYISSSQGSIAGTASAPITIKSEVPLGAVLKVPSLNSGTAGVHVGQPYYVLEGFDVNGTGTSWSTGTSTAAFGVRVTVAGVTIRKNHIWDIASTMCSNSAFGQGGILISGGVSGTVIEGNRFHKIGRLRNGESGCSTTIHQHDHAIYSAGAINEVIKRNIFYDVTRGYPIVLYSSGSTHSNVSIINNTISGKSPTGSPVGQISLSNTLVNVTIKNNIFRDATLGYIVNYSAGTTASGVVISNNIQDLQDSDGTLDMQNPNNRPSSGITSSGNIFNATLGLKNTVAGSEDFTLTASSAAINAGVDIGDSYCGSATDMGVFETCPPIAATINGQSLDMTFGTTILPLQVVSGIVSVGCTGAGCGTPVNSNLTVLPSPGNVVRATIAGITGTNCAAGQTWTVSLNTAVITDSRKIGGSLSQPVLTFTAFPVTNSCSGSPPPPPSGPNIIYEMDEGTGTSLTNTGSGGSGLNGTLTGGPTWGSGLAGSGVVLARQSGQYIAVPYGSGVDPSTQSLTISFWVNVDADATILNMSYFGAPLGINQRAYISTNGGTWTVGIQSSSDATIGDIAVTAGVHHICLVFDSVADQAILSIDGVASTSSGGKKSYTSYTFSGNFELGRIGGVASGGGGEFDKFYLYSSAENCSSIYTAQLPASSEVGDYTLETHRTEGVYLLPNGAVELRTGNGADAYCVANGSIAIHLQVKCNAGTDCGSTSFPLYYSVDGIAYDHLVQDTPTSDGVYYYGASTDPTVNRFIADGPLSGSLPHTDGSTINTAQISQSYSLTNNTSLTVRYLVSFTAGSQGKVFRFRPKTAVGADFSAYLTTPTVTVIAPQGDAF